MASRLWTEDEDKLLLELVRTHSFAEISDKLKGRSRCSCIGRYRRIAGSSVEAAREARLPTYGAYSDDQSLKVLHLIENERLPVTRVAKKMRRSTASIVSHYDEIMRDLAASE